MAESNNPEDAKPSWMRVQGEQPLFLQVAAFEADAKWTEMEAAARCGHGKNRSRRSPGRRSVEH